WFRARKTKLLTVLGAAFGSSVTSKSPHVVLKWAMYVFLGSMVIAGADLYVGLVVCFGTVFTQPAGYTPAGTLVGVPVVGGVVVVEAFFLPPLETLRITTRPTKTATMIAIVAVERTRLRRRCAASRCSRAARAFSFLRARLSALGTGAECIRRILPG